MKMSIGFSGTHTRVFHIENPEKPRYSFDGYSLKTVWEKDLPEDRIEQVRIDGASVCSVCLKAWRKQHAA